MQTTPPAAIFLVDDHPIVRLGYRMLLGPDSRVQIVGEAEKGEDALHRIADIRPDLAVIDLSLPDISGLDVTRELRRTCPNVKVLVVSAHRARSSAHRALSAGARGYIIKDKAEALIQEAIEHVMDGRVFVCDEMREKLGEDLDRLTAR